MSVQVAQRRAFNFLSLPKDIRFMVYDRLPIVTTHHTIPSTTNYPHQGNFKLVTTTAPVAILATCRKIHDEASSILDRKRGRVESKRLPRFIFEWKDLTHLTALFCKLDHVAHALRYSNLPHLRYNPLLLNQAIEKFLRRIPAVQHRDHKELVGRDCSHNLTSMEYEDFDSLAPYCLERHFARLSSQRRKRVDGIGCYVNFYEMLITIQVFRVDYDPGMVEMYGPCNRCKWTFVVNHTGEAEWLHEWPEAERL